MEKINAEQKRFLFIDLIKGIAILLVVIGHLEQRNKIFTGGGDSLIYKYIYLYHMSLFFFCSGFLYKWIEKKEISTYFSLIARKCVRLLIPLVAWGTIMFLYDKREFTLLNYIDTIFYHTNYGCWFLRDLFKYYMYIIILNYLLNKHTGSRDLKILAISVILLICAILHLMGYDSFILDWNLCAFLIGVLVRQWNSLWTVFSNKIVASVSAILFFLPCFYDVVPREAVSISAIIFFINLSNNIKLPLKVLDGFAYLGRNSMPIYLIHFLFVAHIGSYVAVTNLQLRFFILFFVSILISILCLFIYKCLSFGHLPLILFGETKKDFSN